MKTTNQKTLSRQLWERQYNYIAMCNPIVKAILPFDDILTKDMSEIKGNLTRATNVTYKDYTLNSNIPSPELQRVVLSELNSYGHSLVLVDNNSWSPVEYVITDEMRHAVFSERREVNLNIMHMHFYIRLQGEEAYVTFGNNVYMCKHISVIFEDGNIEYYFPIEGSSRVFVAGHSTMCRACKNKTCIHKATKSGIRLYDSYSMKYVDTPSHAYDLHNTRCETAANAKLCFSVLGKALMSYNEEIQRRRERQSAQPKSRTSCEGDRKHRSVQVVSTSKESTDEVWVDAQHKVSAVHTTGGTHASPIAHTVNGYWRRRSKKDDTMIFVESFARGGSEEDRKKLATNITTKQKVFRV